MKRSPSAVINKSSGLRHMYKHSEKLKSIDECGTLFFLDRGCWLNYWKKSILIYLLYCF